MQSSSASAAPTAKPFHDDEMPSAATPDGSVEDGARSTSRTRCNPGSPRPTSGLPAHPTGFEPQPQVRWRIPGRRRVGLTTCRADERTEMSWPRTRPTSWLVWFGGCFSTSGGGRWRRGISLRRGCWLSGRRVASAHVGEGGGVVEVAAAESLGQRRSHRCRMARLSRVSVHDFDWPAGANAMADSRRPSRSQHRSSRTRPRSRPHRPLRSDAAQL